MVQIGWRAELIPPAGELGHWRFVGPSFLYQTSYRLGRAGFGNRPLRLISNEKTSRESGTESTRPRVGSLRIRSVTYFRLAIKLRRDFARAVLVAAKRDTLDGGFPLGDLVR
jgi:hypothetical protein